MENAYLDAFIGRLRGRNVTFRAHAGEAGEGGWSTEVGSLWTGGVGGQVGNAS